MSTPKEKLRESLYHPVGNTDGKIIVIDTTSGILYLKKTLDIYDPDVYAYLQAHKCVDLANIDSYYEENGKLVVYEEYIQGRTLKDALAAVPNAKEKEAWFREIYAGMHALHEADPPIVHRDIKTANIMITSDGKAKLIDYDAAKIYHGNSNRDTVLIGTEGYAAPEQYGFGESDIRTDYYAMGMLLKEMFPGDKRFTKFIEKATHMDPKDRFQSDESFLDAFNSACEHRFRLFPLPGFRSHKPANMILALLYYYCCYFAVFQSTYTDRATGNPLTGFALGKYRFAVFFLCFAILDLFTHWTPFFDHISWLHSASVWKQILGYVGCIFLILFLSAIIIAF